MKCNHNVEVLCQQQFTTGASIENCAVQSKGEKLSISAPELSTGSQTLATPVLKLTRVSKTIGDILGEIATITALV